MILSIESFLPVVLLEPVESVSWTSRKSNPNALLAETNKKIIILTDAYLRSIFSKYHKQNRSQWTMYIDNVL